MQTPSVQTFEEAAGNSDLSKKVLPEWNYNVEAGLPDEIGVHSPVSYQGTALAMPQVRNQPPL